MTPDLVIADANPAYLADDGPHPRGHRRPAGVRGVPGQPERDGIPTAASTKIRRLLRAGPRRPAAIDTMELQEYDIPDGRGGFDKRFWSLISIPVLDAAGGCRVRHPARRGHHRLRPRPARGGRGPQPRPRVAPPGARGGVRPLRPRPGARRRPGEAEVATARRLAALAGVALDLAAGRERRRPGPHRHGERAGALGAHGAAIGVPQDGDVLRLVRTGGFLRGRARYGELPLDRPAPRDGRGTHRAPGRAARPGGVPGLRAGDGRGLRRDGHRGVRRVPAAGRRPQPRLAHASAGPSGGCSPPRTSSCSRPSPPSARRSSTASRPGRPSRRRTPAVRGMAEALQRSLLTEPPQPEDLRDRRPLPARGRAGPGGRRLVRRVPAWATGAPCSSSATSRATTGTRPRRWRRCATCCAAWRTASRSRRRGCSAALDRAMGDLAVGTLATAVLARVERTAPRAAPAQRLLRWSNAGHPPPLLLGARRLGHRCWSACRTGCSASIRGPAASSTRAAAAGLDAAALHRRPDRAARARPWTTAWRGCAGRSPACRTCRWTSCATGCWPCCPERWTTTSRSWPCAPTRGPADAVAVSPCGAGRSRARRPGRRARR